MAELGRDSRVTCGHSDLRAVLVLHVFHEGLHKKLEQAIYGDLDVVHLLMKFVLEGRLRFFRFRGVVRGWSGFWGWGVLLNYHSPLNGMRASPIYLCR